MDEVIKFQNKMAFYIKNTKKDNIMTKEDEEGYRNNNVCRFCEKNIGPDKVGDQCHLTGDYRCPAHSKWNINVTQDQNILNHLCFTILVIMIVICFLKKLVDKKEDKVKFVIIPKTNEEFISVTYGCFRFIDCYRFRSSSLDSSVETLVDNSHKALKKLKE